MPWIITTLHDPAALAATCQRLGLPPPKHGCLSLGYQEPTGWIVRLPGRRLSHCLRHADRAGRLSPPRQCLPPLRLYPARFIHRVYDLRAELRRSEHPPRPMRTRLRSAGPLSSAVAGNITVPVVLPSPNPSPTGGTPSMSHIVTSRPAHRPGRRRRRLPAARPGRARPRARPGSSAARPPACSCNCPTGSTPSSSTPLSGTVRYDNYGGAWGEQAHLDRFLQTYAVEKAKLEARKKGYAVSEQILDDGSIKVQILDGGPDMTAPRRRIVRPHRSSPLDPQPSSADSRSCGSRLEQERAALARWMARLKRAFHAVEKVAASRSPASNARSPAGG